MEILTAIAAELGGVAVWEAEPRDRGVEFVRGQIMKLTMTTVSLPGEEPVPAFGVEIMEPDGRRQFSFAVSVGDLHRAMLMALS